VASFVVEKLGGKIKLLKVEAFTNHSEGLSHLPSLASGKNGEKKRWNTGEMPVRNHIYLQIQAPCRQQSWKRNSKTHMSPYECIQDDRFLETKTWICGSKI